MKLTKNNVKQVLSVKLKLETRDVGIIREESRIQNEFELIITSKKQGINCTIASYDDDWEDTLVTHIKWQLDI